MLIRVDPSESQPLADQIAAQVRGGVARGEIEPGERLPTARDLAGSLGVNMHTVLRAYAALRDEGLVELRRGRGARVSPAAQVETLELAGLARDLVARARRLGVPTDEVIEMVRRASR